jgi:FixJ family two-component response regulator
MIDLNSVVSKRSGESTLQPRGVVFIVDDDVSVRESVDALIRWAGWSVEAFATGEEFLSRPKVDAPSCLILDLNLPDMSGLDLQQRMTESGEEMPTVFIAGQGDIPTTVQAMRAGAIEFLMKPFGDTELLHAVEQGIERSRSARAREARLATLRARYDTLTPRERQVMGLVISGLLNKQVGGVLGTSEITVKAHRGQVMRKMEADSLADLVRMGAALDLPLAASEHQAVNHTSYGVGPLMRSVNGHHRPMDSPPGLWCDCVRHAGRNDSALRDGFSFHRNQPWRR